MAAKQLPPPEERFKITLLSLANILFRELELLRASKIRVIDREILELGIELIKNSSALDIIDGFIIRSNNGNNYWNYVLNRDKQFFLDKQTHSILFGELSSGIVENLAELIRQEYLSSEMMDSLWQHLGALVKISISHIFLARKLTTKSVDVYTNVNLGEEALKWDIDLSKVK